MTPNQPDANQPRKSAFARRIEKFAKQERAAQARKQETDALLAEAEKTAAAARQRTQARDQKAWEQRQQQRQTQATRKPKRVQGDVTRAKRRHEVEDHTDDHASEKGRVWTVAASPLPTAKSSARGRDATRDNRRHSGKTGSRDGGVGPVTGEGNLTLVSPQGPLHISTSGRDGSPEVVGDVTRARDGEPTTSATRRQRPGEQTGQARRAARQGDVTGRPSTGTTGRATDQARQDAERDTRNHAAHDSDGGPVNVVGDGHITVTGARPGQVTRVTNHAAPGAHVGHQSTGHVHGITVGVTANRGSGVTGGEDSQRARDIARTVADRVHRAVADMADALGDVTHDPGHDNRTSGTQAIQAAHVHNSRVMRDHD